MRDGSGVRDNSRDSCRMRLIVGDLVLNPGVRGVPGVPGVLGVLGVEGEEAMFTTTMDGRGSVETRAY